MLSFGRPSLLLPLGLLLFIRPHFVSAAEQVLIEKATQDQEKIRLSRSEVTDEQKAEILAKFEEQLRDKKGRMNIILPDHIYEYRLDYLGKGEQDNRRLWEKVVLEYESRGTPNKFHVLDMSFHQKSGESVIVYKNSRTVYAEIVSLRPQNAANEDWENNVIFEDQEAFGKVAVSAIIEQNDNKTTVALRTTKGATLNYIRNDNKWVDSK
jgi:hypothetical protein